MGYLYILGCIFFTVYGQLILKWRINMQSTQLPDDLFGKFIQLFKLIIFDPFVLSGFISAFLASLFWMAAMSKFALSFAYPFMSIAFILVMFLSIVFFGESINTNKVLGTGIIVLGVIILSQGYST